MPAIQTTGRDVPLTEWLGRVSNSDPHDLPPGALQTQDNLQCLQPGVLSVRGGYQRSSAFSGSGSDGLTSLFGYPRPDGNGVLSVDTAGAMKFRRGGTATSIATGLSTFARWHFEKDRRNRVIAVNGLERGKVWDGFSSAPDLLGIDAPAAAPTVATPTGGAATAGDYTVGYRYVDDRLPPDIYSSLSTTTTATAAANDKFTYTGLSASSQTRVTKVQIWRSAMGVSNVLYLIAELGSDGTITSSANNGGTVRFTLPLGHGLAVGARILVAGHSVGGYNTTHEVTAATTTTIDTDIAYSANGTGGTWTLTEFLGDTYSDSTLQTTAASDPTTVLRILNPNGSLNARRFVVPPNWKAVVKSFQDRFWYAVDVVYTEGTVATTSGSTTLTGTSTSWTSAMAGRQVYIQGASKVYTISSVGGATSITLTEAAAESLSGVTYGIRPASNERNSVYFSEVDEPESVPLTNVIEVQENTDDDDEITGLMPFGAVLYVLKDRHVYSLAFASQPLLDVDVRLLADRGAFNQRCYDFFEGTAYLMDSAGIYRMSLGGGVEPIGGAIQDIFRDSLDLSAKKWFHVRVDHVNELVYFFVKFQGDSGDRPTRAIVHNIRTQQFWTESVFDQLGDSTKLEISGRLTMLLGGERDRVLLANQSGPDMLTAHVRGTATAGGNTTLTDSGANFAAFPVGTPVAIIAGTGKGQLREVASNTSTEITVSSAWTTNPSTDSVYLVGAIEYSAKTGIYNLPKLAEDHERGFEVVFEPTSGANNLVLRRFINHETTARTSLVTRAGSDMGGGVSRTAGSADYDVAMISTGTIGRGYFQEGGGTDHRFQGERWISAQIAGFKGDNAIELYGLNLLGAD